MFSVDCLGDGLVAAGDDAGNLSALRLPPQPPPTTQEGNASLLYKHPKTVWSVAALPGTQKIIPGPEKTPAVAPAAVADVATGSADYMVRVFTPDSGRALEGEALMEAEQALGKGNGNGAEARSSIGKGGKRGRGGGRGVGGLLPLVSEMGVMVGDEEGQLSAFADDADGNGNGGGGDATGGARVSFFFFSFFF